MEKLQKLLKKQENMQHIVGPTLINASQVKQLDLILTNNGRNLKITAVKTLISVRYQQ